MSPAGCVASACSVLALGAAEGTAAAATPGTGALPPPGVGLTHFLVVSAIVFALGVLVILIRRNAIAVLMGLELLLNAAGLNFVAFASFVAPERIDGQLMTLFIIVIAAAEAALALAIVLNLFNNMNTVEVTEARDLKG